jgi:hypothetical protein
MQRFLFLIIIQSLCAGSAAAINLYDASLGSVPSLQDWVSFNEPGSTITSTGTAASINTSSSFDLRAGVSSELTFGGLFEHPLMPVLDRHEGFYLEFSLQVLSETHNLNRDDNNDGLLDRAGFSVITLSQELLGVELAFFEDKIWAYEDGMDNAADQFTQAENIAFDTTVLTDYRLEGASDGYALFANDINILSGDWRNYNPSGVSALTNPYDNPSFLFLGDNTTSASAEVLIGDIDVVTGPFVAQPSPVPVPVPLPAPALMLFAGSILMGFFRHSEKMQ